MKQCDLCSNGIQYPDSEMYCPFCRVTLSIIPSIPRATGLPSVSRPYSAIGPRPPVGTPHAFPKRPQSAVPGSRRNQGSFLEAMPPPESSARSTSPEPGQLHRTHRFHRWETASVPEPNTESGSGSSGEETPPPYSETKKVNRSSLPVEGVRPVLPGAAQVVEVIRNLRPEDYYHVVRSVLIKNGLTYSSGIPHRPTGGTVSGFESFFCKIGCGETLKKNLEEYIGSPSALQELGCVIKWLRDRINVAQQPGSRASWKMGNAPDVGVIKYFCPIGLDETVSQIDIKKIFPIMGKQLASDTLSANSYEPLMVFQLSNIRNLKFEDVMQTTLSALEEMQTDGCAISMDMHPANWSYITQSGLLLAFPQLLNVFPQGRPEALLAFCKDCAETMLLEDLNPTPMRTSMSTTAVPTTGQVSSRKRSVTLVLPPEEMASVTAVTNSESCLCIRDPFTMIAFYLVRVVDYPTCQRFLTKQAIGDCSISKRDLTVFVSKRIKAKIFLRYQEAIRERKECKTAFDRLSRQSASELWEKQKTDLEAELKSKEPTFTQEDQSRLERLTEKQMLGIELNQQQLIQLDTLRAKYTPIALLTNQIATLNKAIYWKDHLQHQAEPQLPQLKGSMIALILFQISQLAAVLMVMYCYSKTESMVFSMTADNLLFVLKQYCREVVQLIERDEGGKPNLNLKKLEVLFNTATFLDYKQM